MKVIISHDIDHFYWSDHFFKDLFVQKYILKNLIFFIKGEISFSLLKARLKALMSNRFGRLAELIHFNKLNDVPASYFVGVENALNLSYSEDIAMSITSCLKDEGCPVYLHGIAYRESASMAKEKEKFQKILKVKWQPGIRMHYLRSTAATWNLLASLEYEFDSSLYELKNPFSVEQMIEFPVSMMEVYMIKYNEMNFEDVKERTIDRIQSAKERGLDYFTVIFHDHHFSESFPLHKKWYEWLIDYFKGKNYEFVNFAQAIDETRKTPD